MSDSELLTQKRAALVQARQEQATAQEWEKRFERNRPLLDGVQVGTLEVVFAWVREFPRDFHPSPESTKKFYDAVQDYIRVTAVPAFIYGSITFPISAEAEYGRRRDGWVDSLQPIFNLSRNQSLAHIETGFMAAVSGKNFNVLWPNILRVLLTGPHPGPGQIDAANDLANDPVWDELALLAQQPEKLMREKCKAFCEGIEARLAELDPFTAGHDLAFRRTLCDYRDGPGRWQELEEVDDKLRRLWIEVAGLDESLTGDEVFKHHLDTSMIAGGHDIAGLPGYSIGGLEGQITLIEENGGVLPVPPDRPKQVAKPKPKRKRRFEVTITKEMLTAVSPLLIRTDFTSDAAWAVIRDEATATVSIEGGESVVGGYDTAPNVLVLDDREFDGLTTEELLGLPWPDPETEEGPTYFFVVDDETVSHPEHPLLAVSLYMEKGETFRVIPEAMAMVEMNLSIANLSFSDYGQQGDGIERYSGIV